jgi:hypothetical protein
MFEHDNGRPENRKGACQHRRSEHHPLTISQTATMAITSTTSQTHLLRIESAKFLSSSLAMDQSQGKGMSNMQHTTHDASSQAAI